MVPRTKKGWLIMKQIFKIHFYVPNLDIKEKVFKYCRSKEISFNYETIGENLAGYRFGYRFKVWNITEAKGRRLFLFMREICGSDFRFDSTISLGFIM